jgi:acyl-CoA reductase-like NAD-dependent aldehyde dehydrogenase
MNIVMAVDLLKDTAGRLTSVLGIVPTPGDRGTSAIIVKEPYGVILGIAPWYDMLQVHR